MRLVEIIGTYLRSSLARKLMLSIILVNTLLVGAIGWELYTRDQISRDFRQVRHAETMVQLLAGSGAPAMNGARYSELQKIAEAAVGTDAVASVIFRDGAGRTVAQARAPGLGQLPLASNRKEIRADAELRLTRTKQWVFATGTVPASSGSAGTVEVGIGRLAVVPFERQSVLTAIVLSLAVIFLGGLAAYLTGRSITERLTNLAEVADRFRDGERTARLSDHGHDEVRLAASMRCSLQSRSPSSR